MAGGRADRRRLGRPAPRLHLPAGRGVRGILTAAPSAAWTLVLERSGRPGRDNMAVDAALLRAAQEGGAAFRLYRWDPPCLSFGRNELASSRYDRTRIEDLGLDTVRRPTGGRAVWHEREVTYAVAAPIALFGSLRDSYRTVHEVIAEGLRALGVPATLAEAPGDPAGPGAGACFASPAGGEVVVRGRKLVGSAQVRERDAFLQHGSILLQNRQDVVAQCTRGAARPPAATSLEDVLGRPVTFDEVADAIARAARAAWTGRWTERDAAPAPDPGRFADPGWTWRR